MKTIVSSMDIDSDSPESFHRTWEKLQGHLGMLLSDCHHADIETREGRDKIRFSVVAIGNVLHEIRSIATASVPAPGGDLNAQAADLCARGICVSMSQARREILSGAHREVKP